MKTQWLAFIIVSSVFYICYAEPKLPSFNAASELAEPFLQMGSEVSKPWIDMSSDLAKPFFKLGSDMSKTVNGLLKSGPKLTETIAKIDGTKFMSEYKVGENNPDKKLNLTQLLEKYGYKVKTYYVTTEDGYIIAAYRIPGKGEPFLIVHGLLLNSANWITVGPEQGLPYLLAERGHDVWLIDTRGSTPDSRGHVSISADTDPDQYWDFSWDEIGRYDLSATIDFILDKTGQGTLKYIGHSQGNTAFLVLMSERPKYNRKVSMAVMLSPVSFMAHMVSPLFKIISPIADGFSDFILKGLHFNEFNADDPIVRLATKVICGNSELSKTLCSSVMFAFAGFDYPQVNVTNLPNIFSHIFGSSSIKQMIHYDQLIDSGKFRPFDMGRLKNLDKYGTVSPPDYPLGKVRVPLAIFYTDDNDWLCSKKDVKTLLTRLRRDTVHSTYVVPYAQFCHMDYLFAKDVKKLVYDKVLEITSQ